MSRFPWEYSTFHPPRKELSGLIFAEQRPMGAQPPDPWGRLGRHPGLQTRRRPRGLRRSFFGGKQRPRTVSRHKRRRTKATSRMPRACSSSCQGNLNLCKEARLSPQRVNFPRRRRLPFVSCRSISTCRGPQIRPPETPPGLPRAGFALRLMEKAPKSPS